jgi:GH25 family lysozyme M1 (1,4-beta-N-acetylmuramidase)
LAAVPTRQGGFVTRAARRRLISIVTAAGVVASAGASVAVLAMSGGNGAARAVSLAGGDERAAPTAAAASRSRPVLAPPVRSASPARVSPTPLRDTASASGSPNQALAAAAAKPPPVVDGVRRFNVGSAHSPQLSQALSRPAKTATSLPPSAGARGIDVASYEHPHGAVINWAEVARAGYKFAFVKVTEGTYYTNPYYATDLAHAEAAGLYSAGYHFAVPNVSSGGSQADYAVKQARYTPDGHTMPLALDIEYNPYGATCYGLSAARMVAWLSAFTSEVRRLTGQLPIIYTTADWWRTCTGDSRAFASDPLWIAAWGPSPTPMPSGWRDWTFWQYTSHGHVPGIDGNVDISYFGRAAVRLLDPGAQRSAAGTAIRLQIRSLNAAAGQPLTFTAAGLPRGLSISSRGLITGTISTSATGGHAVTVTATTPSGGTGSVRFIWTVTGRAAPSPSPTPSRSSPSPSPTGPAPTPSPGNTPPSPGSTSPTSSPTPSGPAL